VELNTSLIETYCFEARFAAFDPSFIRKIGKKTPHLGLYWSGKDQAVKTGLEIGALAVVDAGNNTAFPLQAIKPLRSRLSIPVIIWWIIIQASLCSTFQP